MQGLLKTPLSTFTCVGISNIGPQSPESPSVLTCHSWNQHPLKPHISLLISALMPPLLQRNGENRGRCLRERVCGTQMLQWGKEKSAGKGVPELGISTAVKSKRVRCVCGHWELLCAAERKWIPTLVVTAVPKHRVLVAIQLTAAPLGLLSPLLSRA